MSLTDTIRRWLVEKVPIHELESLGHDELEAMARDIAVSESVLRGLAYDGPTVVAELPRLMQALSLSAEEAEGHNVATVRDMSTACSGCQEVGYCRKGQEQDTASSTYANSCPPSDNLKAAQVRYSSQSHV